MFAVQADKQKANRRGNADTVWIPADILKDCNISENSIIPPHLHFDLSIAWGTECYKTRITESTSNER